MRQLLGDVLGWDDLFTICPHCNRLFLMCPWCEILISNYNDFAEYGCACLGGAK